jgi:homoserine kinase type II
MAVYTDISDSELDAFMAQFDLGTPIAFKGIAEGVSNSNFLLDTERGRFILTVYEQRTDEADLPFFLSLMRWLHDHGYPSATPMTARDGALYKRIRGKPAAIVTFLNGMSVRRPGAAHCREAGVGLARLHLAAAGSGLSRVNTLGQPFWAGMFAGYEAQAEGLKPGLSTVIAADIAAFERLWPRDLPQGVIHADFFPDNVFFKGGKFAAAIDFYFACTDLYAYDVAVCLNAWCFEPDGSLNVTAARAFTAGYQGVRPLSREEKAAVPLLAWGAALRFFLTRLHDFRLGGPGALVKPHDPLEYERKLAVHRAAYAAGEGLVVFGDQA